MARGCTGCKSGARFVGLGALVPLASPAKQGTLLVRLPELRIRRPGREHDRVVDHFAADNTQIDVAWTGGVSYRSGH